MFIDIRHHLEGRTVYVVSDLHMGDGGPKDNFREHRTRFEDFLAGVVESDPDGRLVLAGDVFEFWQSRHGDIVRTYLDLLRRLVALEAVFIVGNHDIDLLGFVGLPVDSPLVRHLVDEVRLHRGGREIRICHGHEFDRLNDPTKALFVGRVAAILAGEVERRVGPTVGGESTESRLERAARAVLAFVARTWRRLFHKTAGEKTEQGKPIDETREALDRYHVKHPDLTVVAGHTHRAGRYGGWYVNAGSWQSPQAHYVKITPAGEVTLVAWPSGEVVDTPVWDASAADAHA